MRTPSFLITDTGITLFIDGQHYAISQDHINYGRILAKLTAKDFDGLVELTDVRAGVRRFVSTDPEFAFTNDLIAFRGRPFSECVTDKVLDLIEAGNDASALFKFLRLVRANPSAVAQEELLLFCVANNFMIDTEGFIVAYKSVNENYTAIHDGKTFYKPALLMTPAEILKYAGGVTVNGVTTRIGTGNRTVVSMERSAVDDRRENTCSYGLHFASFEYASTWAGQANKRLLAFGVNPAHVVSIPNDYGNQKGRASEIVVYSEIDGFAPLANKAVYDFNPAPIEDEDVSERYNDEDTDVLDELDALSRRYVQLLEDFDVATKRHRPRTHILNERNTVKREIHDLCDQHGLDPQDYFR
jgi:hypothetical protein